MISITLPSIYPPALERTLDNIWRTTRGEVEIIVVSPFEPSFPAAGMRVKYIWIPETELEGANAAHATAFRVATGAFILPWVDDHAFVPGWDEMAIEDFEEREAEAGAIKRPFVLGLRRTVANHVGTLFGIYYPYFPLMRLRDTQGLGWIKGDYRVGFADGDLAMRVWGAGGRCEWSRDRLLDALPDDGRKNLPGAVDLMEEAHCRPEDMALFLSRWATRYGEGWDTSHLRGFNIDTVPPDGARTIWKGQPQ